MRLGHTITLPNGATLTIATVCGLRFFHCPRFPEIAAKYDGAGDDEVNAAIDAWERLALGKAEPEGDQQKARA